MEIINAQQALANVKAKEQENQAFIDKVFADAMFRIKRASQKGDRETDLNYHLAPYNLDFIGLYDSNGNYYFVDKKDIPDNTEMIRQAIWKKLEDLGFNLKLDRGLDGGYLEWSRVACW